VSDVAVVTHSPDETRAVGAALGALLREGDVVLLAGGLGAGKTELTKGIGQALAVDDVIVSPTFTLARRYPGRVALVHVDLYRLDRVQELLDLGLEEEGDDAVTVVEWGDVATAHLPGDRLEIQIEPATSGAATSSVDERRITITPQGPSWQARSDELARAVRGVG
jgi:tRNA threonylcarbamoyladenosine biosynthesis protein TsaE